MTSNGSGSQNQPPSIRRLNSWLDGFLDYTLALPTTPRFRLWAGLSTVAAALERRVWTVLSERPLYPNLYIILVSPPGIGKSIAVDEGRDIATSVQGLHVAPTVVTKERLYTLMEKGYSSAFGDTGELVEQSAMTAFADELAVFLKRGDMDFMAALAKLYDCPKTFDKGTQHSGEADIRYPWLNIIGGVTPIWLKDSFTDDAFETGFPARVVLVYDDTEMQRKLFEKTPIREELHVELRADYAHIYEMCGEMRWSKDAATALQTWANNGFPPIVADPKFIHYNRRRLLHVVKLTMVVSASYNSDMVLTLGDFEQAKSILLEAESQMHLAAAAMGSNPYKYHMDMVYNYIRGQHNRTKQPVSEHRIRQRMARDVPLHFIEPMINSMVDMKMLVCDTGTEAPSRLLFPGTQLHLQRGDLE